MAERFERDDLLDIQQAASFLNVSETSLRRWTNAGLLACLRVGGRRERRFRKADLIAFLDEEPVAEVAKRAAEPRRGPDDQGQAVWRGSHLCGLYASPAERVRLAASFLGEGVREGSATFLVAERQAQAAIVNRLRGRVPLDAALERGGLLTSGYAASPAAQVSWFVERFTAALGAGARSFRVVGDVTALSATRRLDEVLEYEKRYEEAVARRFPVFTLCLYDVRRFSGVDTLRTLREHSDVYAL